MMPPVDTLRLAAIALLACAGSVLAAEGTSTAPAAEAKPAANTAARESAKKEAQAKASQQSAMEQFKAQADSFNKDHDALMKQLSAVPEEQKKAILQKMEERKKAFEAKLDALHKQLRDEQRKQRQNGGRR